MFRERLLDSEQGADREYKIWTEEREDLLCRIEDSRISVEQWCIRLANRVSTFPVRGQSVAFKALLWIILRSFRKESRA